MRRSLLDTAIFLYTVGGAHYYREICRSVVELVRDGKMRGETSVEVVHEAVHVRHRRTGDKEESLKMGRAIVGLTELHPHESDDLRAAMTLFGAHDGLDFRNAVLTATALNRGIDAIVSPDRDFEEVGGLERIDPADVEERLIE